MAASDTTLTTRALFCSEHSLQFFQQFIPGADVWSGDCPDCAKQSALLAEAERIVSERRPEIERLVADEMAERGENIRAEADRLAAEYVAEAQKYCVEYRWEFESAARDHIESELSRHYMEEVRREVLEALKAKG
jgi:hypothetical protein